MQYFELTITSFLQKDMHYRDSYEIIAKKINRAMFMDNDLSILHVENKYKNYVFCGFYPTEEDKQYKAGRVYIFNIRTLDENFADKISKFLKSTDATDFKIISIEKNIVKRHFITYLETITPVIVTTEGNKNWVPGDDILFLQKRLTDNLDKKYNHFYQDKLCYTGDFMERIEFLNKVPISINYKNTRLVGNKLKLYVRPEEEFQKMAFIAEAIGLGEKNSGIGGGFCNAQYLK